MSVEKYSAPHYSSKEVKPLANIDFFLPDVKSLNSSPLPFFRPGWPLQLSIVVVCMSTGACFTPHEDAPCKLMVLWGSLFLASTRAENQKDAPGLLWRRCALPYCCNDNCC